MATRNVSNEKTECIRLTSRLISLGEMRKDTFKEIQRLIEEIADRVCILNQVNSKDFRESILNDLQRFRKQLEATQKTLGALEYEYQRYTDILMSIPLETPKS